MKLSAVNLYDPSINSYAYARTHTRVSGRRCTPLKSRGFLKSLKEKAFTSIDAENSAMSFFSEVWRKVCRRGNPAAIFSMKRDIEAVKDISIVKTGVVLFPNLATDNE